MADLNYQINLRAVGIEQIGQVFDTLNRKTQSVGETVRNLNKAINATKGVEDLRNRIGKTSSAMEAITKRTTELQTKISTTEKYIKNLSDFRKLFGNQVNEPLKRATANLDKFNKELYDTSKPVKKLKSEFDRLTRSLEAAEDVAKSYGVNVSNIRGEIGRLSAEYDRAGRREKRFQMEQRMSDARGRAQRGLLELAGLAFTGALPIKNAIDLEDSLIGLNKVFKGTEAQFADVTKQIDQMSLSTGRSAVSISGLYTQASSAGIPIKQMGEFAQKAIEASVAIDDLSPEMAAKTLAGWRNSIGLTLPRVYALADAANSLADNFGALGSDVFNIVDRTIASASSAGVNERVAAAFGAVAASASIPPEIASTAIQSFFTDLSKAGVATSVQKKAFEALGFDNQMVSRLMQENANGMIFTLLEAISKVPKESRTGIITQLFGSEAGTLRTVNTFVNRLDRLENAVRFATRDEMVLGSINKEFVKRMESASTALKRFVAALFYLSKTVGNTILPTITALANWAADVLVKFANFANNNQGLVKSLYLVFGSIIALNAVFFAASIMITGMIGGFLLFRRRMEQLSGTWKTFRGAIGNSPKTMRNFGGFVKRAATAVADFSRRIIGLRATRKIFSGIRIAGRVLWTGLSIGARFSARMVVLLIGRLLRLNAVMRLIQATKFFGRFIGVASIIGVRKLASTIALLTAKFFRLRGVVAIMSILSRFSRGLMLFSLLAGRRAIATATLLATRFWRFAAALRAISLAQVAIGATSLFRTFTSLLPVVGSLLAISWPIALAIGATAGGMYLLYRYGGDVLRMVGRLGNSLLGSLWPSLNSVYDAIKNKLNPVLEWFSDIFSGLESPIDKISKGFESAWHYAKSLVDEIKSLFSLDNLPAPLRAILGIGDNNSGSNVVNLPRTGTIPFLNIPVTRIIDPLGLMFGRQESGMGASSDNVIPIRATGNISDNSRTEVTINMQIPAGADANEIAKQVANEIEKQRSNRARTRMVD